MAGKKSTGHKGTGMGTHGQNPRLTEADMQTQKRGPSWKQRTEEYEQDKDRWEEVSSPG